jgi:spore germination protein
MIPKTNLINYKTLVSQKLKEKLSLFITGLMVTGLTFILLFIFIFPKNFSLQKKSPKAKTVSKKKLFPKTYITKEGDFLWQIAEENYGSGFNAYDIAQANKLTDPNNLPPGTKLILPPVTPKAPTKGEISAISSDKVTYKQEKYIVQPGDSLSIIAFKVYGDYNAWPTLAKINNLPNPEAIEVGMVLIIPR